MSDRGLTQNYVNQSWPIAGGGYALLTIVTPTPLPAIGVVGLEDVVLAVEQWRTLLADAVHPTEGNCPFCHCPLSEHTDAERLSCERDIERRDLESRMG